MTRPLLTLAAAVLFLRSARGLEPAEIVILVNRKVNASRIIADHYVAKRGVPKENVVELTLPRAEDISRGEYDRLVVSVLRDALAERKDTIKCLLSTYGIPLRVGGQEMTNEEQQELDGLKPKLQDAKAELAALEKAEKKDAVALTAARMNVKRLEEKQAALTHKESLAAFDSELMLLWQQDYRLGRWQPNPLHWQFPADQRAKLPPVLMTSRLDGPTPDIAMRLVDDAVEVEAVGLAGKVYIDARGIGFDPKKPADGLGYAGYDESFRETAALFRTAKLDVTLDDKNDLFATDSCPDAAVYAGWYALGNYRPCCRFVKGAVAWHLASGEAVTLRDDKSKAWCPNLLKAGVAATLGPVAEPYTIGFPKPAEFFGFLATGKYTLVEAYSRTVYFASWMTVLVGDPLYNPYKKTPKLDEAQVRPSPKGGVGVFK